MSSPAARDKVSTFFRPISAITVTHIRQMYDLYAGFYENTSLDVFLQDLSKKSGVILVTRKADDRVVGFSTQTFFDIRVDGKRVRGIFSGDTIVDPAYWGNNALANTFYRRLVIERIKHPFVPFYWFLISKGYKTYLLLTNNFYNYYPNVRGRDEKYRRITEAYCEQLFPQYFDRKKMLLDFGDDYVRLKGDVAARHRGAVHRCLRLREPVPLDRRCAVEVDPQAPAGHAPACRAGRGRPAQPERGVAGRRCGGHGRGPRFVSMARGTRLGHHLLKRLVEPGRARFARHLDELESVQRARLARWLAAAARSPEGQRQGIRADWSWEEFARQMPVTDYTHYAEALSLQRQQRQARLIDSPVMRHQPTSGSTSAVKWIPYTKLFLDELDQVITAWVGDLYRQFPHQARGTHYWSLSWIPTAMRGQTAGDINDDMKMLSWGKRLLAYMTQAAPQEIALAETSDDSLFATAAWLAADTSLGFMSVWSPTFGIGLLEQMGLWRAELAEVLQRGEWGRRASRMAGVPCPRSSRAARLLSEWDGHPNGDFFRALWPNLALLSAWDTAAAAPWARKLQALLPHAAFQGKGLWATEGVVTFPFEGRYPLAYLSHAYEFEDAHDGRIHAPWQLREGQEVIPLLTTGSGFARYRMSDVLRVEAPLGEVPCFTFLGRNDGVDLVGEKTSAQTAQAVQDGLRLEGALPVTLLALDEAARRQPGYVLLVECDAARARGPLERDLARQVEAALQANFHYKLARELGQLQPAACVALPDMRALYLDQCRERGMIEGNIKIEPLRHWTGPAPSVLRDALDGCALSAA